MKQVMVVWNQADERTFERNMPLLFGGQRNRRLGSRNQFDILFLDGLQNLAPGYREALAGLGYTLHDTAAIYREFERKYAPLARFGNYELKCFLRWLVIREYFGAIPIAHFDADVIFNATPEELLSTFCGLTFILQGCPAMAFLSDPSWFDGYRRELNTFITNMETYSAYAWSRRSFFLGRTQDCAGENPEADSAGKLHDRIFAKLGERLPDAVRERNGEIWERRILGSDQDLMQFATLDGRLPQAGAAALESRGPFALFSNPLCIARDIMLPLPLNYERREGVDFLNGRKVAIWHMQNDFCDYLGYASFRNALHRSGQVLLRRTERPIDDFLFRALRKSSGAYSRLKLSQRYFGNADDFSFLFNDTRYWQTGVFCPKRAQQLTGC